MAKWNVIAEESKSVPHWQQHQGSEDIVEVKISRRDENFRVDVLQTVVRSFRELSTWHNRVFAVAPSLNDALKASTERAIDANISQCLFIQSISRAHATAVDYIADELGAEKSKPVCTAFEFRNDNPQDEVSVEVIISWRSGNVRAEIIEKTSMAGFVSRKSVFAIEGEFDALIRAVKLRASLVGIDDSLIDLALADARIKILNHDFPAFTLVPVVGLQVGATC